MKKCKRSITRVIAMLLVLVCSLGTTCFAADTSKINEATKIADKLYAEGLFLGYGKDSNGKPIYGLEDSATRSQAVVMMVRIMGKTEEANNAEYSVPFVDVPNWAKQAIGYAYTHGLTAGTSATTFSPNLTISNTEYITFCLRALGYDANVDFEWDKAYIKANELGVIEDNEYTNRDEFFSRADMVIISYNTLMTKMKNSHITLAEYLGISFSNNSEKDNNKSNILDEIITYVNAEDSNNLVLDNLGNMVYDIGGAAEGTVIRHSDLELIGSANENVTNFFTVMNQIDSAIEVNSDGKITYNGHNGGVYKVQNSNYVLTMSSWGGWSAGTTVGRNIFLNALVYFGGEDMGTAVYGMLDEHYRFRSDGSVPISNELAAKYGLTINHIENRGSTYVANVSNGMDTWNIRYSTENPYGAQDTIIKIPT